MEKNKTEYKKKQKTLYKDGGWRKKVNTSKIDEVEVKRGSR